MPNRSFRDLQVWQKAIELSLAVYALTAVFPHDELFGLTSQLRRASVSVPSNIAEGADRGTTGEFRQFLGIAKGSNAELQTQLIIARSLHFGEPTNLDRCESLSAEVTRMLLGLLASLPKP